MRSRRRWRATARTTRTSPLRPEMRPCRTSPSRCSPGRTRRAPRRPRCGPGVAGLPPSSWRQPVPPRSFWLGLAFSCGASLGGSAELPRPFIARIPLLLNGPLCRVLAQTEGSTAHGRRGEAGQSIPDFGAVPTRESGVRNRLGCLRKRCKGRRGMQPHSVPPGVPEREPSYGANHHPTEPSLETATQGEL